MRIQKETPVMLFDNRCYLCAKFAKMAGFFARGRITMIGHYTAPGEEIRNEILDEAALEMFWFIDKRKAYGGRAAILPLLKSILHEKGKKRQETGAVQCQQGCKTVRAVFARSASLITSSRTIDLSKSK